MNGKAYKYSKVVAACASVMWVIALFALAFCIGCTSTGEQPAKSQTQNNKFDECQFVFAANVTISNKVIKANGGEPVPLEFFTQTQALESKGNESYAQTASPTTDVKPDVDVRYNDAIAGATSASKGVLESLIGASANKVLSLMDSKQTGTVSVTKKDGTAATVKCENGQCSLCDDCEYKQ